MRDIELSKNIWIEELKGWCPSCPAENGVSRKGYSACNVHCVLLVGNLSFVNLNVFRNHIPEVTVINKSSRAAPPEYSVYILVWPYLMLRYKTVSDGVRGLSFSSPPLQALVSNFALSIVALSATPHTACMIFSPIRDRCKNLAQALSLL